MYSACNECPKAWKTEASQSCTLPPAHAQTPNRQRRSRKQQAIALSGKATAPSAFSEGRLEQSLSKASRLSCMAQELLGRHRTQPWNTNLRDSTQPVRHSARYIPVLGSPRTRPYTPKAQYSGVPKLNHQKMQKPEKSACGPKKTSL